MEYVPGKTLGAWIGRKGLKMGDVLKLSVQIADAVAAARKRTAQRLAREASTKQGRKAKR